MNWELISHYAVPPLVGAVIGYFTNMIAVKMLFFPHEEKRIFGWRVPFTPGAIPKGKARLAKSAGRIVQNELFTREDISGKLLTEEVEKPLIDRVMAILGQNINEIGSTLAGSLALRCRAMRLTSGAYCSTFAAMSLRPTAL